MLDVSALSQLQQIKQDLRSARNQREATVRATQGRFGFAMLDDGKQVFLAPDEMKRVLPGDRVLLETSTDKRKRVTGKVVELLDTSARDFPGRVVSRGNALFIRPDFERSERLLYVPPRQRKNLNDGDYVIARVVKHPFEEGRGQARAVRRLGNESTPGIAATYMLARHELANTAPVTPAKEWLERRLKKVLEQRTHISEDQFFTIDASHTRDIDDALNIRECESGTGWILKVAIADPDCLLPADAALVNGQSLYFPDREIPMLPEWLAHDLASLVAGQARPVLLCTLSVDPEGEIRSCQFEESVITVKNRLDFQTASQIFENSSAPDSAENTEPSSTDLDLRSQLVQLSAFADARRAWRARFALVGEREPQYSVYLDESGSPDRIEQTPLLPADLWVEEAMLATNISAAEFMKSAGHGGIFVVHEGIRPDRLAQIYTLLGQADRERPPSNGDALAEYISISRAGERLQKESGPESRPVRFSQILRRQLTRTRISTQPGPHCGLGLPCYTTITSPIRRAPDLFAHRVIKALLRGENPALPDLQTLEKQTETRRSGNQAMQGAADWSGWQFAARLEGQVLEAEISQVNSSGFTVRTCEHGLRGQINLANHPEKHSFASAALRQDGPARSFSLGDRIKVRIVGRVVEDHAILMELDDSEITAQQTESKEPRKEIITDAS